MIHKLFAPALIGLASLGLVACGGSDESADAKTGWAGIAEKAREEISQEMATGNMDIGRREPGMPRAALSPQGDLVIDGATVALSDAQRELLLAFRTQLVDIAQAGAAIGIQGAALATNAMKEAAKAALSGDGASIDQRIEKEAEPLKIAAQALCDKLPALLESQRIAAEAIPEFRPYATMTEADVKDCTIDGKDKP